MHWRIGNLCALPEGGVNDRLLMSFKTDYSLDDLLDIEEIDNVSRSWRDAAQANIEAAQPKKGRRR